MQNFDKFKDKIKKEKNKPLILSTRLLCYDLLLEDILYESYRPLNLLERIIILTIQIFQKASSLEILFITSLNFSMKSYIEEILDELYVQGYIMINFECDYDLLNRNLTEIQKQIFPTQSLENKKNNGCVLKFSYNDYIEKLNQIVNDNSYYRQYNLTSKGEEALKTGNINVSKKGNCRIGILLFSNNSYIPLTLPVKQKDVLSSEKNLNEEYFPFIQYLLKNDSILNLKETINFQAFSSDTVIQYTNNSTEFQWIFQNLAKEPKIKVKSLKIRKHFKYDEYLKKYKTIFPNLQKGLVREAIIAQFLNKEENQLYIPPNNFNIEGNTCEIEIYTNEQLIFFIKHYFNLFLQNNDPIKLSLEIDNFKIQTSIVAYLIPKVSDNSEVFIYYLFYLLQTNQMIQERYIIRSKLDDVINQYFRSLIDLGAEIGDKEEKILKEVKNKLVEKKIVKILDDLLKEKLREKIDLLQENTIIYNHDGDKNKFEIIILAKKKLLEWYFQNWDVINVVHELKLEEELVKPIRKLKNPENLILNDESDELETYSLSISYSINILPINNRRTILYNLALHTAKEISSDKTWTNYEELKAIIIKTLNVWNLFLKKQDYNIYLETDNETPTTLTKKDFEQYYDYLKLMRPDLGIIDQVIEDKVNLELKAVLKNIIDEREYDLSTYFPIININDISLTKLEGKIFFAISEYLFSSDLQLTQIQDDNPFFKAILQNSSFLELVLNNLEPFKLKVFRGIYSQNNEINENLILELFKNFITVNVFNSILSERGIYILYSHYRGEFANIQKDLQLIQPALPFEMNESIKIKINEIIGVNSLEEMVRLKLENIKKIKISGEDIIIRSPYSDSDEISLQEKLLKVTLKSLAEEENKLFLILINKSNKKQLFKKISKELINNNIELDIDGLIIEGGYLLDGREEREFIVDFIIELVMLKADLTKVKKFLINEADFKELVGNIIVLNNSLKDDFQIEDIYQIPKKDKLWNKIKDNENLRKRIIFAEDYILERLLKIANELLQIEINKNWINLGTLNLILIPNKNLLKIDSELVMKSIFHPIYNEQIKISSNKDYSFKYCYGPFPGDYTQIIFFLLYYIWNDIFNENKEKLKENKDFFEKYIKDLDPFEILNMHKDQITSFLEKHSIYDKFPFSRMVKNTSQIKTAKSKVIEFFKNLFDFI